MKCNPYYVSWLCLLEVLRHGYNIGCWIAPIPEKDRALMLERGKKYIEMEKRK